MSPVPRHAGPTERRPFARKVLTLLCLGLGWLWAAVPVVAQVQAPPSAVEATGPYRNLAENHNGTFHLRREGNAVYATFRTDRSPVQFLARDQPEALLTVPAGFRPAVDITWEVSARPVRAGTTRPDPSERRVFRMHVDTAGQVRYVDDPGVDGVGHLGYDTALAWPLAGTEPRLCDHRRNIREGILAAVQALEDIPVSCTQVDWTHLARIRTLSLDVHSENFARHDLLGLTNLAVLQVSGGAATYPDDLMAHTPRMQTLKIEENTLEDLPANLFRYTPRLAHLSLGSGSRQDLDLPVDLLAYTHHLESLQLEGRYPAEPTQQLLAHTPRLTRLTVMSSTPLPETFLANVPRLTHMKIKEGFKPCATPELLASVPHLRHVAVRMAAEARELACLDRALRLHTPALVELHVELQDLQDLDSEILPGLPRLTRLNLDVGGLTRLPAQLLAEVPELSHLTLRGGTRDAALTLPEGFFTHTPRLTSLSLQVERLQDLPPDLLAPVPELRQVRVEMGNATSLPDWFLERVTELRMGTSRSALPADFLMHAPHLEVLHLTVHSLRSLPEGFLAHAPSLVELRLHGFGLWTLPPTFLAHAPRLETFRLDTGHQASLSYLTLFPEGFLTHAPSLVELRLRVPVLHAFPPSFLGHVPRLEILELETTYDLPVSDKENLLIQSLPANFLIHAPRLRYLALEPLRHVASFPPGFLSGSPQLRYLNLDASSVSSLPTDFLSRHPHLETVRLRAQNMTALPRGFLSQSPHLMDLKLDLQRVEALPRGFLTETSHLRDLEIDVHEVAALPPGFLAHAPHLTHLNLRALNLTAWPADFLADAPRIQTLGLAMPLLEPTLTTDHPLWETLQAISDRVKVILPDPFHHLEMPESHPQCIPSTIKLGDILEVEGRALDDHGNMLLLVSRWRNHDLFANFYDLRCRYLIDARSTSPTFEVCAAEREPEECDPLREW